MDKIVFRDGKAFAVRIPSTRYEEETIVEINSLLSFLNSEITIESATLGDIWRYMEVDSDIYEIIFAQSMGQFKMQPYLDQILKPSKDREDEDPNNCIKYLELGWSSDLWEEKFFISTDFRGVGLHTHEYNGKKETSECSWAIEFTLINDLKHYPIVLNDSFGVWDESNKNRKLLFSGKKNWTVYDMICGMLFELTFVGLPSDQILATADLDQRMAEVKDSLENDEVGEEIE